jgi:hypothetical protein
MARITLAGVVTALIIGAGAVLLLNRADSPDRLPLSGALLKIPGRSRFARWHFASQERNQ